jgi:hypothetical protein
MISLVLRNIVNRSKPIPNFHLHVCLDNNIFLDEISEAVKANSVFVLIPTRLGLDSI